MTRLLLAFLLCALPFPAAGQERVEAVVTGVEKGDVLWVTAGGVRERVNLIGIWCPDPTPDREKGDFNRTASRKGDRALAYVRALLAMNPSVVLEFDQRKYDKKGRLEAYLYLPDGRMLNELLLKEGLARTQVSPPNVRYQKRLEKVYQKAIKDQKKKIEDTK